MIISPLLALGPGVRGEGRLVGVHAPPLVVDARLRYWEVVVPPTDHRGQYLEHLTLAPDGVHVVKVSRQVSRPGWYDHPFLGTPLLS